MNKIISYLFKWALLLSSIFFVFSNLANAQNQPHLLDYRTCDGGCSANNYTITDMFLSDANGNPLSNSLATCTPGVKQTAYISFTYQSNSNSSTNNTRLFADLIIGNRSEYINIWFGTLPAAKGVSRTVTLDYPFEWTCGLEVLLDTPLLAWTTTNSSNLFSNYQCNSYPSAQCQIGDNIVIKAPLAVQFDFTACTVGPNTSVKFTSTTNGGTPPYTYSWNFGNNASPTTSTQANPTVNYTSSGTATLTVTDSKGIRNQSTRTVTVPNELIVTPNSSQPTPGNQDGTIT